MGNRDDDRRVRRTKASLRQALTELMGEKDVRAITVRELTDRADVNRGTFYAHYRDIYDMVEQQENEIFAVLSELLSGYSPQQLRGDLAPVLANVFQFVEQNRDLLPILLEGPAVDRVFRRLYGVIYDKCLGEWAGIYPIDGGTGLNFSLEFIIAGTVGLVRAWAQNGFQVPYEEMAALTGKLIQQGLRSF